MTEGCSVSVLMRCSQVGGQKLWLAASRLVGESCRSTERERSCDSGALEGDALLSAF